MGRKATNGRGNGTEMNLRKIATWDWAEFLLARAFWSRRNSVLETYVCISADKIYLAQLALGRRESYYPHHEYHSRNTPAMC